MPITSQFDAARYQLRDRITKVRRQRDHVRAVPVGPSLMSRICDVGMALLDSTDIAAVFAVNGVDFPTL
ncbi:hypothetical protein ACHMZP_31395 [Rhodococcus baikonurensis]|uniref:hypothetical protein n=1 Tax=Rhodococcus baikonurensis TaxID=172041 RepID=UPI0037BC0281